MVQFLLLLLMEIIYIYKNSSTIKTFNYIEGAYYEKNGRDKQALSLIELEVHKKFMGIRFNSPAPLKSYGAYRSKISEKSADYILKHEDDVHHIVVPFYADGIKYVIDAKYRVRVHSQRVMHGWGP